MNNPRVPTQVQPPRQQPSRSPLRLGAALALLLLSGCKSAPPPPQATGITAWDRVEIAADAAEPIVTIPVHEGMQVAAGDVIVQQQADRANAALSQASAERARAQAVLAELERGTRSERIDQAEATLSGANAALKLATAELARQRELTERKLASAEALDRARAERDRASAEREAAAAQLTELRTGATPEELAQARHALAAASAAEGSARIAVGRLTLTAPAAGRIDALPFEPGERPQVGAVVAVLLTGPGPYARVYVPEPIRAQIHPGSLARVKVDGAPQWLTGRVRSVSADPIFTPFYSLTEHDRQHLAYLAEVDLEGAEGLPAGVPVEVDFGQDRAGHE